MISNVQFEPWLGMMGSGTKKSPHFKAWQCKTIQDNRFIKNIRWFCNLPDCYTFNSNWWLEKLIYLPHISLSKWLRLPAPVFRVKWFMEIVNIKYNCAHFGDWMLRKQYAKCMELSKSNVCAKSPHIWMRIRVNALALLL